MAAAEITTVPQYTYVVPAALTRQQHARFARYLRHSRELYNASLEARRHCHGQMLDRFGTWKVAPLTDKRKLAKLRREHGEDIPPELLLVRRRVIEPEVKRWAIKTKRWHEVTNAEQARELTELRRDDPDFAAYPRRMQRWALNLVEAAYKGMFTRHRQGARGKQIGFPSFRSALFWNTVGWDSPLEFTMRKRGLHAGKSLGGTLRLKPDRELPPWEDCTVVRLCRDGRRWFAHLTYKVPAVAAKPKPLRPVGIDIGLIQPVMRSDGVAPALSGQSDADTAAKRRAARALAGCRKRNPKRSKRKLKLRERLRRIEARIARRRHAKLHTVSARLTHHFDAVAVEDLNLRGLNRGGGGGAQGRGTRRKWRDLAPGTLLTLLEWKAKRDGRQFVRVDPRGTSIECSACGARVPKRLRERTHRCKECGAVLDRDHNAALNVLARAGWGPGAGKPGVRELRTSAAPGAGLALKHGGDAAGPRRVAKRKPRPPPSPLTREHVPRSAR